MFDKSRRQEMRRVVKWRNKGSPTRHLKVTHHVYPDLLIRRLSQTRRQPVAFIFLLWLSSNRQHGDRRPNKIPVERLSAESRRLRLCKQKTWYYPVRLPFNPFPVQSKLTQMFSHLQSSQFFSHSSWATFVLIFTIRPFFEKESNWNHTQMI